MMLAIRSKPDANTELKVNLLPCKVKYDGPVEVEVRYWNPRQAEDGKHTAYFRGRKLEGNSIKVPESYKGSILRVTTDVIPTQRSGTSPEDDEDEVDQTAEETRAADELGTFDEVMVWNHDMLWDASEDAYAKGIGEWMSFANAIHSQDETSAESAQVVKAL